MACHRLSQRPVSNPANKNMQDQLDIPSHEVVGRNLHIHGFLGKKIAGNSGAYRSGNGET